MSSNHNSTRFVVATLVVIIAIRQSSLAQPSVPTDPWIDDVTAESLSQLPLDSPRLMRAYELFYIKDFPLTRKDGPTEYDKVPTWKFLVEHDIINRGILTVPLFLKLLNESPEEEFRAKFFGAADYNPTLPLQPFLDFAKNLWRERGSELNEGTVAALAWFISRQGSANDLQMLQEMHAAYPLFKSHLVRMEKRLAGTLKPEEWFDVYGRPPPGYHWPIKPGFPPIPTVKKDTAKDSPPSVKSLTTEHALPVPSRRLEPNYWVFWLGLITLASAGAVWLMKK